MNIFKGRVAAKRCRLYRLTSSRIDRELCGTGPPARVNKQQNSRLDSRPPLPLDCLRLRVIAAMHPVLGLVTYSGPGPGPSKVSPVLPGCGRTNPLWAGFADNSLTGIPEQPPTVPGNCTAPPVNSIPPPKPFNQGLQCCCCSQTTTLPMDIPFLRPMKTVEGADRLIQHAHVLYEQYEHIMKPIERTLAEDRITFATDVRHGVEEKFWLAQGEQASLYSDLAQEALETVKVVSPIPSLQRGTDKFFLVLPELGRPPRRKKSWVTRETHPARRSPDTCYDISSPRCPENTVYLLQFLETIPVIIGADIYFTRVLTVFFLIKLGALAFVSGIVGESFPVLLEMGHSTLSPRKIRNLPLVEAFSCAFEVPRECNDLTRQDHLWPLGVRRIASGASSRSLQPHDTMSFWWHMQTSLFWTTQSLSTLNFPRKAVLRRLAQPSSTQDDVKSSMIRLLILRTSDFRLSQKPSPLHYSGVPVYRFAHIEPAHSEMWACGLYFCPQ
ncbi:hypothetical protein EDB86DRAFT_2832239 [Lactarius hatsudake]|nr:hypothetical protein EDB86DRAFT_2832239 [Lactarius hatsudake]